MYLCWEECSGKTRKIHFESCVSLEAQAVVSFPANVESRVTGAFQKDRVGFTFACSLMEGGGVN